MRRLVLYTLILTGVFLCQHARADVKGELDTIIKVEGKIMVVNIVNVTTTYVRFTVPDNNELYTMSRKDIHKVIYKSGGVEVFNPMVVSMIDDLSWQAVWLTEDPKDLAPLYKLGEISAQSPPSSRSPKAAKKSAIIRLQKKAAAMKGTVVYVTKKQTTGGYGEYPGYYIEGTVYGTEPSDEMKTDKD